MKGPTVSGKQDQLGEQPQPPLLEPREGKPQDEKLWGQDGPKAGGPHTGTSALE